MEMWILLTECYSGVQAKHYTGKACGTYGTEEYAFSTFVGHPEGKRLIGRHTDITIMYLREIRLKGMDWTNLAQERDK
jgi:hypothetical protein